MIHQYINNGFHIIMDVNSGSVHSVDPVMYDAVAIVAERDGASILYIWRSRGTGGIG